MAASTNGSAAGAKPTPLWIDGQEVYCDTTFDVVNPATGEKVWAASSVSVKQAQQAADAAQRAFKSWRKTKPAEIQKIFLKAADIMEERTEELAGYMKEETGALAMFTQFVIALSVETIRDAAGRAANIHGAIPTVSAPGQSAFIFKEPFGVILGIAPWNAPYALGVRAFLSALVGGNTAVLKGPELSPRCYWAIGSIFKQAGLPDGVLNVVYHQPSDAAAVTNVLIEHAAVRKVNFTGSTSTGSIIAAKAGRELKPVLMELGGKASALVCEDADIPTAAFQCALGSLMHAGQICMSTERILVNRKVLEPFAEALKGAVQQIYAPSGDAPVVIARAGAEKSHQLWDDAVSKGAKVLYGDTKTDGKSGYRLGPVIVSDVKKDMDLFYTESFGPSVSLIAVDSDEEAIEMANDTVYGLSGAVFTKSLGRGLKIAKQIDSGAIHINSMSVHDESALPHGGYKKSGWGRFNAQWGVEEFLQLKTVTYMDE